MASLGDASINHSTAVGALNAAGHAVHQRLPLPLLVVCEDNGWGISRPDAAGLGRGSLSSRPGFTYVAADGADPVGTLAAAEQAVDEVRETRRPVVLHLQTVRFLGHAGSDAELGYRPPRDVAADQERDPLLGTAGALVEAGWEPEDVLARYEAARTGWPRRVPGPPGRPAELGRRGDGTPHAPHPGQPRGRRPRPQGVLRQGLPEEAGPLTLAQSLNAALTDLLAACPQAIVLGEDVGTKGGVYGVTLGLQKAFGAARVFDTPLDEQTILGLALGARWPDCFRSPRSSTSPTSTTPRTSSVARPPPWASSATGSTPTA